MPKPKRVRKLKNSVSPQRHRFRFRLSSSTKTEPKFSVIAQAYLLPEFPTCCADDPSQVFSAHYLLVVLLNLLKHHLRPALTGYRMFYWSNLFSKSQLHYVYFLCAPCRRTSCQIIGK